MHARASTALCDGHQAHGVHSGAACVQLASSGKRLPENTPAAMLFGAPPTATRATRHAFVALSSQLNQVQVFTYISRRDDDTGVVDAIPDAPIQLREAGELLRVVSVAGGADGSAGDVLLVAGTALDPADQLKLQFTLYDSTLGRPLKTQKITAAAEQVEAFRDDRAALLFLPKPSASRELFFVLPILLPRRAGAVAKDAIAEVGCMLAGFNGALVWRIDAVADVPTIQPVAGIPLRCAPPPSWALAPSARSDLEHVFSLARACPAMTPSASSSGVWHAVPFVATRPAAQASSAFGSPTHRGLRRC